MEACFEYLPLRLFSTCHVHFIEPHAMAEAQDLNEMHRWAPSLSLYKDCFPTTATTFIALHNLKILCSSSSLSLFPLKSSGYCSGSTPISLLAGQTTEVSFPSDSNLRRIRALFWRQPRHFRT